MGFAAIIQVGQHRVTVHLICRFLVDGSTLLDVVDPDIFHQFLGFDQRQHLRDVAFRIEGYLGLFSMSGIGNKPKSVQQQQSADDMFITVFKK